MTEARESSVVVVTSAGDRLKVSVVKPEKMVLDEEAIIEAVGEKNCTRRVFDRDVLEAAIAAGKVDTSIIAELQGRARHAVREGDVISETARRHKVNDKLLHIENIGSGQQRAD